MKAKKISKGRTCILRLMITEDERVMLKHEAYVKTGGNVSEYVRRTLFPKNGASDETNP